MKAAACPATTRRAAVPSLIAFVILLDCTPGFPAAAEPGHDREAVSGYMKPPEPIATMLDAPPTPTVLVGPGAQTVALLGRSSLPPVAELAEPVLGLAGYRINPKTNGPDSGRVYGLTSIAFVDVATGATRAVALPDTARFIAPGWSPDGANIAFVLVRENGMELWVAEAATGEARRLTSPVVNSAFRSGYEWLPDGTGVIASLVLPDRGAPPEPARVPAAPIVQENVERAAPAPTYRNLLRNRTDEARFDYFFTSSLAMVPLHGGRPRPIGEPGLISDFNIAPGGGYILQTRLHRPYSYSVPASRFPAEIIVTDMSGKLMHTVAKLPLRDSVPSRDEAAVTGPRAVVWRSDAPATLVWAEARNAEDASRHAAVIDRVYTLSAPFTKAPTILIDLAGRFGGILWGRKDFAIVVSHRRAESLEARIAIDPSRPGAGRVLQEQKYRDRYNNPGRPMMAQDANGMPVMHLTSDGHAVFVSGSEVSRAGRYPFLARMDLATGETTRLWQSEPPYFESPVAVIDDRGDRLLTWRESRDEPPNLYVRDTSGGAPTPLTDFRDPAPEFAKIGRRLITYKRADGVQLSGTLYLPAGYDRQRDGPLPMLMWAYPAEYTDADTAGQIVGGQNRFVRPHGVSPLFMLTRGYAVLNGPSMPIVGEDGAEPNDSYVEQLVMDAEAAVHAVVELGVADPDAIAIGGHSYGAFMAANLLAHTDLYRAGIALSGAYNRTLTPFGFQSEQRSYWEAVETYTEMSPFTHVRQIDEPILLMHGGADPNTGTFPLQSERFYTALKGNGATARFIVLPLEGHGYHARESVMHALWEIARWLDLHVKP